MAARFIPAISDGEILRILKLLQSKYPQCTFHLNIDNAPFSAADLNNELLMSIGKINGYTFSQFTLNYGRFNISYQVNHGNPTSLAKYEYSFSQNASETTDQWGFFTEASKQFVAPPVSSMHGDPLEALAGFKKIETALAGAVGTFADLQAGYQQKNDELREKQFAEIEEIKAKYDQERNESVAELDARKQEMQAIQKQLDDRSNTHARRDIRKEIKSSINDSLKNDGFASNVESKRKDVRYAFWGAIVVLLALTAYSTFTLNTAVEKDLSQGIWFLGIKASISGISLVGFLLLYLRWETSWLNQRANYESLLASTRVDIDRASWVAESLLEWNRESPGVPIPNELLASFTRRLFDWDAKVEDHQSASDSLASVILGSAARVQIGPSGANLEIDRKGLKELAKA